MVRIFETVSLKDKNTFSVECKAKFYVEIINEAQILSVLETNAFLQSRVFFLGGGSNTLFVDDFDGMVIHLASKGIRLIDSNKDTVAVEVDAGVNWHNLVEIMLKNKFYGLENLALIPGTVGGAVAQNIGAYGVELKDFIYEVRGVDVRTGNFLTLTKEECKFGYRTSIFKNELKDYFIISSAKFQLHKKPKVNLSYPELKKQVSKFPFLKPDPKYVFDQVVKLRKSKLPDLVQYPNAGSFFKNPIVNVETVEKIREKYDDIPIFKIEDGRYKVPAGWLIEKAGWKGRRIGNVGTYDKHALVIINYGVSKGKEILDFAELIKSDVLEKFDILLENEVEIVN